MGFVFKISNYCFLFTYLVVFFIKITNKNNEFNVSNYKNVDKSLCFLQ
jgi:hypothetical protein